MSSVFVDCVALFLRFLAGCLGIPGKAGDGAGCRLRLAVAAGQPALPRALVSPSL